MKEKSTLKKVTIHIIFQRIYFLFFTAIIKAVLPANKPESMTDYTTASGHVKVPAKVYIDGVTGAGAVGDYTLTISITS